MKAGGTMGESKEAPHVLGGGADEQGLKVNIINISPPNLRNITNTTGKQFKKED